MMKYCGRFERSVNDVVEFWTELDVMPNGNEIKLVTKRTLPGSILTRTVCKRCTL